MKPAILIIVLTISWNLAYGATEEAFTSEMQSDSVALEVPYGALDTAANSQKIDDLNRLLQVGAESSSSEFKLPKLMIIGNHSDTAHLSLILNVDSLIRSEISQHQLAILAPRSQYDEAPLENLRSDSAFINHIKQEEVELVLVWDLKHKENRQSCKLVLVDPLDYSFKSQETIIFSSNLKLNQQTIKKAVWTLLGHTLQPELFPKSKRLDRWLGALKSSPKRSAALAASAAIILWFVFHDEAEETQPAGIGSPPDWPQN